MEMEIIEIGRIRIALLISDRIISKTQDVLEIMSESLSHNCYSIILYEKQIAPDFFVLKSGIAGEMLQKFSLYDFRLAIIGDFSKYASKSLRDFIFESNKHRRINFVSSVEEAKERLIK